MPPRPAVIFFLAALLIPWSAVAEALLPAQSFVDEAAEGDVVVLPPGVYAGPIFIDKAITLDGKDQVTIDAGGKGSVVVIDADGAVIKNLRLINSGDSHNDLDSGVQIRGNFNVVKDNRIEDTLFGVDLKQSNNNIIRRNYIRGRSHDLGVRGDSIRLWYSFRNKIEDNDIAGSRDMVVWYSANNIIRRNLVKGGRYALHFMYSRYNLIEANTYINNSVGTFLMYSDDVIFRNNRILHGQGATGMGIGLKETSNVTIEGNEIVYCSIGIYLDVSPFQPETSNRIHNNRIAYNGIGIKFLSDWTGNEILGNRFENNLVQVTVADASTASRNLWSGNYWDDYRGFDRDHDGIGDTPYDKRIYSDRLWMDVPFASFFRGVPALSLLDFLERLVPFTDPILLLRDDRPRLLGAASDSEWAKETKPEEQVEASAGEDASRLYDPFGLKERLKGKR